MHRNAVQITKQLVGDGISLLCDFAAKEGHPFFPVEKFMGVLFSPPFFPVKKFMGVLFSPHFSQSRNLWVSYSLTPLLPIL